MAYETLKDSIKKAIKQNGNQEITGDVMQTTLLSIVSELGQEKQFLGFATPSTNPGAPKNNVFYFASEPGEYTNFKRNGENEYVVTGYGLYLIYNVDIENNFWNYEPLIEVSQGLGKKVDSAISQNAARIAFGESQKCVGILDKKVCSSGDKYAYINELFVDLMIIVLTGDNVNPAPCIINTKLGSDDRSIVFFQVDENGKYVSPVEPKAFKISIDKNATGLYKFEESVAYTDGSCSMYVVGLLNLDLAEQQFDGYVPAKLDAKIFRQHHGMISDFMFKSADLKANNFSDCNKFYPLNTTTLFIANGGLTGDKNYAGYLSDYIPVSPGEKYLCFTNFTGYGGSFKSNIFGYTSINNSGVAIGGICSYKSIAEITIPDGIRYIRVNSNILDPVPFIIRKNSFSENILKGLLALYNIQNIGAIDTSKILNGNKILYKTQADIDEQDVSIKYLSLNSFRYIGHTNKYNSWFTIKEPFIPTGKNLVHIKFSISDFVKPETHDILAALWISRANDYVADGSFVVANIDGDGDYDITFDPSFYEVYKGFEQFWVWISHKGTGYEAVTFTVNNFEIFELKDQVSGNNMSGSNAKELFKSLDSSITSLSSKIDRQSLQSLKSPSGKEFKLNVGDDGALYSIPVIPDKGYFFGNSLIVGSGFGMAASDSQHDYYYLINNFIKTQLNNLYSYSKSSGTSFEGIEAENDINSVVSELVNRLSGDENLVAIQLGDNVNTDAKNAVFPKSSLALCKAIRNKCPRARVVWMGMWYGSQAKYEAIRNACDATGCQFISFEDLKGEGTSNRVGGIQNLGAATRTINTATEVTENSVTPLNVTVSFTVGADTYSATLDVDNYSFSGQLFTYTSKYSIITQPGVASHPGDEGFRRIANKFLYEMKLTMDDEYYKNL